MRKPLCYNKVPEDHCVIIPQEQSEKLSKLVGQRVPFGDPWLPCALEKGHEGCCVPACNKPVAGRYFRAPSQRGPKGNVFEESCWLPKGHEGKCRDKHGCVEIYHAFTIFEENRLSRR